MAQNFVLTPEIQNHLEKITRVIEKYIEEGDQSGTVHFMLRFEKRHMSSGVYIAEIDFHARHTDAYAKAERDNLIVALDEARDEISQSLRTHKDKKIHFIRKGARKFKEFFKGFPLGKK